MSRDEINLRAALSRFCSGVTIVTVGEHGNIHGMTANAFSSVSLDPPLVLVCIARRARMHERLSAGPQFGISILSDSQASLSRRFSGMASETAIEFEWHDGVPVIAGAISYFVCAVFASYEAGDHTIYVGQIRDFGVRPGTPLVYYAGQLGRLDTWAVRLL